MWIDDAFLGPVQSSSYAWRDEVVNMLKQIRPSFIRDTQGQLADAMPNRIADPYARMQYNDHSNNAISYSYSMQDLVAISAPL